MPPEYLACVASEQKRGKSRADARRVCAIAFYKRHGKTPAAAAGETTMTLRERLLAQIKAAAEAGEESKASNLRALMETGEAAGDAASMSDETKARLLEAGILREYEGDDVTEVYMPAEEGLQEVYAVIDGSYEATIGDLQRVVQENPQTFGGTEKWDVGIEATFPSRVVVRAPDEQLYRADYKRDGDGITFSDIRKVQVKLQVAGGETIPTRPPKGSGAATLAGESPIGEAVDGAELMETYTAPVRIITEKDGDTGDHLMTVECLLGRADTPTQNGRVYPRKLFESLVAECAQGTDRAKQWLGEGDHPADARPRLMETVCKPWRNLRLDGNELLGETDIIPTSKGTDVQMLIRNGVPVQVSSRTRALTTTEVRDGAKVDVVDEKTAFANWGGWDYVLGAAAASDDGRPAGVRAYSESDEPAAIAEPTSDVPGDSVDEVLDMKPEEVQKLIDEAVAKDVDAKLKPLLEAAGTDPGKTEDTEEKGEQEKAEAEKAQEKVDDISARVDKLTEVVTGFVEGQNEKAKAEAMRQALAAGAKAILEIDEVKAWPDPARALLEQHLGEVKDVKDLQTRFEDSKRVLQEIGLLIISKPAGRGLVAAHVGSSVEKSQADRAKEFQAGGLADELLPETKNEAFDLLCEGIPDNGMRSLSDPDDPVQQMLSTNLPFPGYHPGNPRHVFRSMLENTIVAHPEYLRSNLRDSRSDFRRLMEWTGVANVAQTVPYVLPLIRQVWMRLIAMELCSIQPMNKSTGAVHFLDFLYDPSNANPAIPGQWVSDYAQNISEQALIPEVKLTITSAPVEMDEKKLKAEWSTEVAQNLRADHGVDIASEMITFMADEIAREVNALILNVIRTGADPTTVITAGNVNFGCLLPAAGYTDLSQWQPEIYRHILQADALVQAQRRGPTNWIVAGQNALIRLMRLEQYQIKAMDAGNQDWNVGINYVGDIAGYPSYRVYGCPADVWPTELMMVGRKGPDWYDAGMVFCPFLPLYASGLFVDPNTLCQREAIMSRFGYVKVIGNTLATVTCLPAAAGAGW